MTFPPDRLGALIKRLEAGEKVTQSDVNRIAQLQALDLALFGQACAREHIAREEAQTEIMRQSMEDLNTKLAGAKASAS
jgi:hypothetical protein